MDDLNDREVTTFEVCFEVCDAETVPVSASCARRQPHRIRVLPKGDNHRDAHDSVGKCCPPTHISDVQLIPL
jgi:hypothetical protein